MWQVIYDELKDQGLEIIAVALDAGGKAATEAAIRCADLAERDGKVLAPLMGWDEDLWERQAPPQYPCLIDAEHVVADLYGITNVPMAVWIDEEGRIVRPAETAGMSDNARTLDPETFALPQDDIDRVHDNRRLYVDALRDWVRKGADSQFALSPDEVRAKLRRPSEDDVRAALHARLGHHLFEHDDVEAAKRHFREATALAPHKWNYRRQSMMLDPERIGELNAQPEFFAAVDALGEQAYFEDIDMPGFRRDPHVTAPAGAPRI